MFTEEEISFIMKRISLTSDIDSSIMRSILERMRKRPQVIVTIEGGAFQWAHGNCDLELIIEDKDNIEKGDDLYYPVLTEDNQEGFDEYLKKAKQKAMKIREVRIFVHDPDDRFPYQIMVNGEVVDAAKTMEGAAIFLQAFIAQEK